MNRARTTIDEIHAITGEATFSGRSIWSGMSAILLVGRLGPKWGRGEFVEVYERGHELLSSCDRDDAEALLVYIFTSFQTMRQLSPVFEMIWSGGYINGAARVQMFSIPAYTSLLEGCYSNLARGMFAPLSKATGKDYSQQNTLAQIVDVFRANKFQHLCEIPEVELRNAINHGRVIISNASGFKNCSIEYMCWKQGRHERTKISSVDFERKLFDARDAMCGALLGMLAALESEGFEEWVPEISDEYVRLMYWGFEIGGVELHCLDANSVKETETPQINFTFETENTNCQDLFICAEGMFVGIRRILSSYAKYFIAFSNPRLAANFLRADREQIDAFEKDGMPPGALLSSIVEQGEFMWFEPSDEKINLAESYFFCFPFYDDGEILISGVEDFSLPDRKRLKANVYMRGASSRERVIHAIRKAVNWTKALQNPPNPTMVVKHGNMEADCVYLRVYKDELDDDRSLAESNENFICSVEYCPHASFKLTGINGFIKYLYENAESTDYGIKILWRDKRCLPKG